MRMLRLEWRWASLKNGFLDATAYRIEFLIEVLSSAVVPVVTQLVLAYAIFRVGGIEDPNKTLGGLHYAQFIQYALTSLLFSQIRGGDHDFELAEMIRTGGLSNYMLRPVSVVEFIWIRGIAPKLFLAAVCLVVGIIVGLFFGLEPGRMFGAMLLALVGNIIHYQISAALASVAFYWEEAFTVLMVKNMVVSLLSGELIYLGMFPEKWQWIWKVTPFYLYVYGPTQYALGQWSHAEFLQQLGVACLWLVVGWLLIRTTWGIGQKRYTSLGG